MKPWDHWHHETHETMKPLTLRNLWNHETIHTTKPMKPRNTWNYETTDTTRPMKQGLHDTIIIWHKHWHILISTNSCTVTPSNNHFFSIRPTDSISGNTLDAKRNLEFAQQRIRTKSWTGGSIKSVQFRLFRADHFWPLEGKGVWVIWFGLEIW